MPGDPNQPVRDHAAEVAKVPIDDRVSGYGHEEFFEEDAEDRRRDAERRTTVAESRAASRAPRRLRLNITQGPLLSPGYVVCSAFQSDNGVNWACAGSGLVFSEDWFAAVFGGSLDPGRRIEFEIVNPHDVTD